MPSIYSSLAFAAAATTVYAAPAQKREFSCEPLPLGSGPTPYPDTPVAFLTYDAFARNATAARTPAGYVQAYQNLHTTYNEPSQFVQYMQMDTYDVQQCANACNNNANCNAFTVFYERLPVMEPGPGCMNPISTTQIKCDLWAGTILPTMPLNAGQMREDFHVVMAGSNAYVKDIVAEDDLPTVPRNYAIEAYKNGAAIEAPTNCNGQNTYMGMSYWRDGRFDVNRCITSCQQAGAGDVAGRECRFVNTYMQRRNGVPYSQHCSMYSEYWPSEYATNFGQLRGTDEVDISKTDSFGIRDITGDYSACLPGSAPSSPSSSSSAPSTTTVTSTSTVTPSVTPVPIPSATFTPAIIAPETFSDWDPVLETITYTSTAATSAFTPAVIAPETFSDWDPVMETTIYASAVPTFV